MKRKILYIIDSLEFGGGERLVSQLINRLCKDKFMITVACHPTGAFMEKIEGSGVQAKSVDMRNRYSLKVILQLVGLMKRDKIDIVHSLGARADFFARMAAKLARVPVVVSTVAMPVEGFDVGPLRKKVYSFFNRFSERYVDLLIVDSEVTRNILINRRRIPTDKVVRIYNGIELKEYQLGSSGKSISKIRNEFGIDEGVFLIGAIGRMVWQKGFDYLIEAIPEVSKEYPEARFLLVGDGPLKNELKVKSIKLKVEDKVVFTRFRKDLKNVLSTIDLLIIPSLQESFPIITLDAMAMAKPIIATRIGGIIEQITDGENGILIPPGDPSALAKAIIVAINNKELCRNLGLMARRRVGESFSLKKMVAEMENVYQSLLLT